MLYVVGTNFSEKSFFLKNISHNHQHNEKKALKVVKQALKFVNYYDQ